MDDDNNLIFQVNLTDLDLNQEPTVQSLLSQLDSAHERVEARIRQIEAAEEIQRQQQNPTRINLFPGQTTDNANHDRSTLDGANHVHILHRKPGGSHLVAKPLELNSDVSNSDKDRGSFYDCNICLEMASDPVLTCCGHLFCWPCFYQVSNINSTSKECPVCKGEVSETTVTPIYGNGGEGERVVVTESGLRIPPRPRAHRVESIRQHIVTHGLNNLAIEQALRQIRPSLVSTVWPAIQGGVGGDNADNEPGFLPQTDDSLSYLSSFLSGADMLMQLDTVMNNRTSRDYVQDSGGPDLHVAHPYSLRGRRRRFTVPSGSAEGGRGARESRRRRRLNCLFFGIKMVC